MTSVLVLLADGTEELEAVTVIDVLRRAEIDVVVAGLTAEAVTASRGVRLIPDTSLDALEIESFDALVLPGGNGGTEAFKSSPLVVDWVKKAATRSMILAAICAAPSVLLEAGVLRGKKVTSYPGALDPEASEYTYLEEAVVEDDRLITSRGPGTALDFALTLVERLAGSARRAQVEAPLLRT